MTAKHPLLRKALLIVKRPPVDLNIAKTPLDTHAAPTRNAAHLPAKPLLPCRGALPLLQPLPPLPPPKPKPPPLTKQPPLFAIAELRTEGALLVDGGAAAELVVEGGSSIFTAASFSSFFLSSVSLRACLMAWLWGLRLDGLVTRRLERGLVSFARCFCFLSFVGGIARLPGRKRDEEVLCQEAGTLERCPPAPDISMARF